MSLFLYEKAEGIMKNGLGFILENTMNKVSFSLFCSHYPCTVRHNQSNEIS